ncbi:hypothetical protein LZQ00_13260 [Sphingobacterium sp. SRCM116780]|uniref:hypothetical protein n=1 Tax=Sphingobacterium sp. SRCM116780 TaxID=2907623 RepID=UPI001F16B847|nr:hypothetical protein [Sphingobacterium sp. SRCM116780]UIR55235.1 hypothetical protein LZQ00_13260 [Sphingobacterium sp. SRCM116780]
MRHYLFALLFSGISLLLGTPSAIAQEKCELTLANSLTSITQKLNANEYNELDPLLIQMENSCGQTELSQRIRILNLIIQKENSTVAITQYLDNSLDEKLLKRFRDAAKEDYAYQYESNKAQYDYFPLRHPLDLLIKTRAKALLQSQLYVLNDSEIDILRLFSNEEWTKNQEVVENQTTETVEEPAQITQQPTKDQISTYYKSKIGYIPYIGIYGPIGGKNTTFGTNVSLGFTVMSSLARSFVFEGGIKVRINSNDKNFDYNYYDQAESVNAGYGLFAGGAIGYKVYDNTKFILLPKLNLGVDIVDTGISEEVYNDGYYDGNGYYIDGGNATKLHTVNTMHLGLSLAGMIQVNGKKYMGIEAGYHYTPYQWDSQLISSIYNHYGSIELFFRF